MLTGANEDQIPITNTTTSTESGTLQNKERQKWKSFGQIDAKIPKLSVQFAEEIRTLLSNSIK